MLQQILPVESAARANTAPRFTVALATTKAEVQDAQALRFRVFGEEMGAQLEAGAALERGLDVDRFDPFCEHLIVRDTSTQDVVGTYRILSPAKAKEAGSYYSESEFDLTRLAGLRDELVEIGRSCVHPDFRGGAIMTLLWSGLATYMRAHQYRYLMGCASISMADGGHQAASTYRTLCDNHSGPPEWRVFPKCPLPLAGLDQHAETRSKANVPPLLKAYMRSGAYICGEPAWDADFNTADLFLLLPLENLTTRHASHFKTA
jgi:putative hemolysin